MSDKLILARFKRRLAAFTKAAYDLSEVWEKASDAGLDIVGQHAYPFHDGFDSVCDDIQIWADTQAYLKIRDHALPAARPSDAAKILYERGMKR